MKIRFPFGRAVLPATLLAAWSATAQTASPTEAANRFGASFRMAFNVDVNFKQVGAFAPLTPRLTPDGDAFNYDDGYVLTDSSGNLMGFTRYWGYDSAAQLPGDGTIVMHRSSSSGRSVGGRDDEPQLGVELTYARELGRGDKWRWGLEGALNYMNVGVNDGHPLSVGVNRLTAAFALPALEGGGTVTPPPAPYYHGADLSPEGNPVLTATPSSSTTTLAPTAVTGRREFDADVFGLRFGPYVEMPLGEKWTVMLSGGLALAEVSSDFSFRETVAVTGVPAATGSGANDELLVGGYVAGNVSYQVSGAWALFGGAQFQGVGDYAHRESGRTAVLNLSESLFVTVGASFSF